MSSSAQDRRKYYYAIGTREVSRLHAALLDLGLGPEINHWIRDELWFIWRLLRETAFTENVLARKPTWDSGTYADGGLVTTQIDWEEGYATIVHHPEKPDSEVKGNRALAKEVFPCPT